MKLNVIEKDIVDRPGVKRYRLGLPPATKTRPKRKKMLTTNNKT